MGPNLGQPDRLEKDDDHHHHHFDHQVGSSLGQHDLLAEESGPLLPSVLPAPEVNKLANFSTSSKHFLINLCQPLPLQGREALPIPLALASPERSAVDEQSFKVQIQIQIQMILKFSSSLQ